MTHQYMEIKIKELEKRIETLEQEPILDKIRAEIEKIEVSGYIDMNTLFLKDGQAVKECALDIIDKYKAESEARNETDN